MRNSKMIVAAAAISAILGIDAASAADLPARTYTKAPAMEPAYNWAGFYIGVNGGYGWKDPSVSLMPNDVVAATATSLLPASYNISGGLGGVQGGYNWQFNQSWLLGLDVDFDWSNLHGSGVSNFGFNGGPASFIADEKIDSFGTVKARLGYLPTDKLLLFGTGGFAYGHIRENVTLNANPESGRGFGDLAFFCVTGTNCFNGSSTRTAVGWTAGAGFEYAFWQNVSVKFEYQFVDLGHGNNVNIVAASSFPVTTPSSFTAHYGDVTFNVVKVGLNYRFGGPSVARY
jgi:outer membrane immunogenic protein